MVCTSLLIIKQEIADTTLNVVFVVRITVVSHVILFLIVIVKVLIALVAFEIRSVVAKGVTVLLSSVPARRKLLPTSAAGIDHCSIKSLSEARGRSENF